VAAFGLAARSVRCRFKLLAGSGDWNTKVPRQPIDTQPEWLHVVFAKDLAWMHRRQRFSILRHG
jgi:hypothetical protein